MYVDSEEDPAGTKGTLGRAGSVVFVSPYELEQHGDELVRLGENLRAQVGAADVQPLRLGAAPPALWFAAKLARLTGPEGTPTVLREWADGLTRLGGETRASVADYRSTDGENEDTFTRLGEAR
jgi:hypothetical protein